MAIVRGQWYQWKVHPDQFYKVSVVAPTYIQLYPYDTSRYPPMYVTSAYVQANFRLLPSPPQNFLIDGAASGKLSITRANLVHPPVIWGSVSGKGTVAQSHALLDTTLRGKARGLFRLGKSTSYLSTIQVHANVTSTSYVIGNFTPAPTLAGHVTAHSGTKGSDFSVYPLGGNLGAHWRVLQAQADQG